MTPKEIVFRFEKRNVGSPYFLSAQFDNAPYWVFMEWEKKPTQEEIETAKKIFLRACRLYHRHIKFPDFELTEVQP